MENPSKDAEKKAAEEKAAEEKAEKKAAKAAEKKAAKDALADGPKWVNNTKMDGKFYKRGSACKMTGSELKKCLSHGLVK